MKNSIEITHANMVAALAKPGAAIQKELTAADCNLLHAAVGIAGEAGEIIDTVKKTTVYRKPRDIENLTEELGDLEFYMEQLRAEVGISREDCLAANIAKLAKRYPNYNYSDQAAQVRADKA